MIIINHNKLRKKYAICEDLDGNEIAIDCGNDDGIIIEDDLNFLYWATPNFVIEEKIPFRS